MWIFKKTYTTLLFLAIFLAGMFLSVGISPETGMVEISSVTETFANNNEVKTTTTQDTFDGVIKFFNSALGILTILVSPLIMFAGWLMSPDWVTGDFFGLREPMYRLWMTVSNIIYFVYAILLIFIAIATLFNSKNYGYKTLLPRLFIGILLVPASWWFVQFIVSTATMVTATVLEIPWDIISRDLNNNSKTESWYVTPDIPGTIDISMTSLSIDEIKKQCRNEDGTLKANSNCKSPQDIINNASGIYSPLLIYGYGIFKIQEVKTIDNKGTTDLIKDVASLINGMVFSLIMMFVFGILVIALTFVLLIRAMKLWMYAIFSPLFSLKIVLGDQWKDDSSEMFSIKEFIGLAFVPAVIWLALSFGLIVANTITNGISYNVNTENNCDMTQEANWNGKPWCIIVENIMGNPENGIYQKLVPVSKTPGQSNEQEAKPATEEYNTVTTVRIGWLNLEFKWTLDKSAPTKIEQWWAFLSGVGTIIVEAVALVFIWVAFMAAAKVNKWVATIIEPFEKFWKSIKDMGQQSIKHVPLPIFGNVHGLGRTMDQFQYAQQAKLDAKYNNSTIGQKFGNKTISADLRMSINNTTKILQETQWANVESTGSKMKSVLNELEWLWMWHRQSKEEFGAIFKQIEDAATKNVWKPLDKRKFAIAAGFNVEDPNVSKWINHGGSHLSNKLSYVSDNDSAKSILSSMLNESNNPSKKDQDQDQDQDQDPADAQSKELQDQTTIK